MIELSPADWLPSCTARIVCERVGQPGVTSTGTGFFYDFDLLGEVEPPEAEPVIDAMGRRVISVGTTTSRRMAPTLVTNKHVIENCDWATIWISVAPRGAKPDELRRPTGRCHLPVRIPLNDDVVVRHTDPEVDLCAISLARYLAAIEKDGQHTLANSRLYSGHRLPVAERGSLRHIESVAMVGYPNGLWDDLNNAPLVRRGTTATHPLVRFKGRPEFVIDMACFGGSSGSPVFLYQDGLFEKNGEHHLGVHTVLLGVLYAGPVITVDGKIELRPVPQSLDQMPVSVSRIPMNLGHVIHASELDVLGDLVQAKDRDYINKKDQS